MSSTEIQVFTQPVTGAAIRLVKVDPDEIPWFVAKDVCDALGLARTATSMALLDDDEKGIHTVDTLGGAQEMQIVSEPGLYSLVLRSRKPEAKAFKRWVTHDVLPNIRRTGRYARITPEPQTEAAALVTVVTHLVQEIRSDRQGRPISEDQRRQLMRRGHRLHGSSAAAWRHICGRFDYRTSDRQFSTVTVDHLSVVTEALEQGVNVVLPLTEPKALATANPKTVTIKGAHKTRFKGRICTLKQLVKKLNAAFNTDAFEESAVETLIDKLGLRNEPWSRTNALNEDAWDEDAYDWLHKTCQEASAEALGRRVPFALQKK
jgi:prophage antirepressor-like protein